MYNEQSCRTPHKGNGDMKRHNLSNEKSCRASEMHLGSACHVTDVPLIYCPLNMSWICP